MSHIYRQALAAARRARGSGNRDQWQLKESCWEAVRETLLGSRKVFWSKDCRTFLTTVGDVGIVGFNAKLLRVDDRVTAMGLAKILLTGGDLLPRESKKQIPLADIELVVRRYRALGRKDSLALRTLAYIPVVRHEVLTKRKGLLYSKVACQHHRRVSEWCTAMRGLADDAAEASLRERHAQGKRPPMLPESEAAAELHRRPGGASSSHRSTLQVGARDFEMIPFAVYRKTLLGKARGWRIIDLCARGLFGFLLSVLVWLATLSLGERLLPLRCAAHIVCRRYVYQEATTKADLADFLCKRFQSCRGEEALPPTDAPSGAPALFEEIVNGKLIVRATTLRNTENNKVVTLTPLPMAATDALYWDIAASVKACGAVGLPFFDVKTPPVAFERQVFLPRANPLFSSLGVYGYFLPFYHGPKPYPEVCVQPCHHTLPPPTARKGIWNLVRCTKPV